MQFPKRVKDTADDLTTVVPMGCRVEVESDQVGEGTVYMLYTPRQARRLARALKKAAKAAEGNGS